ncbi:MAG: hypothetical protein KGK15_16835 [Burkholderiales bacterium]|nr:hypothetical protein [Pandoraea sp.]MBU6493526.1 hypothetical protein [Burkholderiales bacterium]MDE2289929.1 hypothetical protein [Burkholderiales bacterium]MDE2608606.1 hypothetical protein [Burkholderiales bacterium]TAM18954.1 MAG: hypothetical protein EPN65_05135 [Pandoraea sp.]
MVAESADTQGRAILRAALASALTAGAGWTTALIMPPDARAQTASSNSNYAPDLIIELRARPDPG